MQRRGFLSKLIGGIVAAPVVAKAFEAEAVTPTRTVPGLNNFFQADAVDRERLLEVTREFLEEQRGFTLQRNGDEPQFVAVDLSQVTAAEVAQVINAQTEGIVATVDPLTDVVSIRQA